MPRSTEELLAIATAAAQRGAEVLRTALAEATPEIGLLSEEAGVTRPSTTLMWVVDPLDGTSNFARGYPIFSISIACVAPDGPLCGVVLDPLRGELFRVIRGGGAWLCDRSLRVSTAAALR